MSFRVGIDVGGTFTDVLLLNQETGEIRELKLPSTPLDPSIGFIEGLDRILTREGIDFPELKSILHGTTVGTNAILQRKFADTGLIVTRGYRAVLEIARQTVPGQLGAIFHWIKPERVVPLENVKEVTERLDYQGRAVIELNEEEVRSIANGFRSRGIKSVAVSLLWSFVNPEHEERVYQILKEEHPACFVSLSSRLLPEYKEYERTNTTAINALLMPHISTYVDGIERKLDDRGIGARLFMMKSSGGIIGSEAVKEQPIYTTFSGPAAGAMAAAYLSEQVGCQGLISLDMGGTSTDICYVEDGRPLTTSEAQVGDYPIRTPIIDLKSIGAGGGSIAWVGPGSSIKVGPKSAGADPGPVCYDQGGTEPTLTDANLVLGRIPPYLLCGEIALNREKAREAMARYGERVGLDPIQAASTIVEVACYNMNDAIREISTRRGRDPRDCALVAMGGSGPGHAGRLAEALQVKSVIIPPSPGLGSALGLFTTDIRNDYVMTDIQRTDRIDIPRIHRHFSRMEEEADRMLANEEVPEGRSKRIRSIDFRYKDEPAEINVEVTGPLDIQKALKDFHERYKKVYGYNYEKEGYIVEIVNLRVTAIGHLDRPRPREIPSGGADPQAALKGHRKVFFEEYGDFVDCRIFDRAKLFAGNLIKGPAIIEEYESTNVIYPGHLCEVDRFGNLLVAVKTEVTAQEKEGLTPLVLEIIEGTIESSKVEMEAAIERTARSTLIREQHDYRAGIYTAKGESVSSVSFAAHVEPIFKRWSQDEIREGDVFLWNDPYLSEGGIGHLPDICVTKPIFYEEDLVGFVVTFGHTDDIGGMLPGGLPAEVTEMYQEGLMIPPMKLYKEGRLNEEVMELILRNVRFPELLKGDLNAFIGAMDIGVGRVQALCRKYGRKVVEEGFEMLLERCARAIREKVFPLIEDGEYFIEDFFEQDQIIPEEPRRFIRLCLKMTKTPEKIVWDWTGTDKQVLGSVNFPGNEKYYEKLLACHFAELCPGQIMNEGVRRVTSTILPLGTVLSPSFPAATSNRMWPFVRIFSTPCALFNLSTQCGASACLETIFLYGLYGYDEEGNYFFYHEEPGGGGGGRPYADGSDTVDLAPNAKNLLTEYIEGRMPIFEEVVGLARDSGGPGKYRGGLGYIKEIRLLSNANLMLVADRMILQPFGVMGGKAGKPHTWAINPRTPQERVITRGKFDQLPLKKGDLIRFTSAGGGGWGDPLEREPERVRMDVIRDLVSPESARDDYGVVIDPSTQEIHFGETAELRRRLQAERGEIERIDRGENARQLIARGELKFTTERGYFARPSAR